jgi:hypothetical protein
MISSACRSRGHSRARSGQVIPAYNREMLIRTLAASVVVAAMRSLRLKRGFKRGFDVNVNHAEARRAALFRTPLAVV